MVDNIIIIRIIEISIITYCLSKTVWTNMWLFHKVQVEHESGET